MRGTGVFTWLPTEDPEDSCRCCHKFPTMLSKDLATICSAVGHLTP